MHFIKSNITHWKSILLEYIYVIKLKFIIKIVLKVIILKTAVFQNVSSVFVCF